MGKHEGPQKDEQRRFEFSKLIVVLAIIMWIEVNVFGMIMMALTGDLSPMVYVLASVDAVMAVICATYSYKAKAENVIKLKKLYGVDTSQLARESIPIIHHNYDDEYYDDNDVPIYEDASIV